uniref:Uncharacterized protein n=1 Tax=Melanopsichium pennsylvanicum 4 TaxID=1398559 RepID=A0A077RAL9_9BASI|nr:conserved hypothetical protein [Melanopsichium pennsylvanicum 4]
MARGQKHMVVLKSKVRGGRTKVTALTTNGHVSTTSSLLAAGLDGSLTHWDLRSNLNSKPSGKVEDAHQVDTVTSSIAMGLDGYTVATRGGEGSVKLWDLRKFKTSLAERKGLDNASAHTSVIFDPFDARSLITCVSGVPIHAKNNITLGLGTDDKQNHSHNHNDQEADAVMVGNKVEGNGKIVELQWFFVDRWIEKNLHLFTLLSIMMEMV